MVELIKSMMGVFLPKEIKKNEITDILETFDDLEYHGVSHGKKEMRNDFLNLQKDFRKSVEESKREFEVILNG